MSFSAEYERAKDLAYHLKELWEAQKDQNPHSRFFDHTSDKHYLIALNFLPGARTGDQFESTKPWELVEIWETGRNGRGKPLNDADIQALIKRWRKVPLPGTPDPEALGCLDRSNGSDATVDRAPLTANDSLPDPEAMLGISDVLKATGLSRSSIDRMVKNGRFPKPLKPTGSHRKWPGWMVSNWITDLEKQRKR